MLDHFGMWPDLSCHGILMNIERETLGAPPGTRVSDRALLCKIFDVLGRENIA